ncbi:hypothetical protein BJ166DRAFT_151977 [Pestalotiopsis sp. NC0098]|nr:hypothetical protein BJ166DRAFT_151977 [Pestalotiopsis sp. NC0098]
MMPRKVRIPASKDESRQAQQRSRARHRDYVAGLEMRIAEYERRGVHATLEMQRAAREVAATNERLLALLALRGVSQQEVEAFLGEQNSHVPDPVPDEDADAAGAAPRIHGAAATMEDSGSGPTCHRSSQDTRRGEDSGSRPADLLHRRHAQNVCMPLSQQDSPLGQVEERTASALSKEVTSCETAATMIVNLRGTAEGLSEARQALGCSGNMPCSVKNTHLFQLMSEIP